MSDSSFRFPPPPPQKPSSMPCKTVSAVANPSPSRPQVRQIYFCGRIQRYVYKENKQTMINDLKEEVTTRCIIILTSRKNVNSCSVCPHRVLKFLKYVYITRFNRFLVSVCESNMKPYFISHYISSFNEVVQI